MKRVIKCIINNVRANNERCWRADWFGSLLRAIFASAGEEIEANILHRSEAVNIQVHEMLDQIIDIHLIRLKFIRLHQRRQIDVCNMSVKRMWFLLGNRNRYPIGYEIHPRSWVDMHVKQCVRICCPDCGFAWADVPWMVVQRHRALVFTCCDPFWLVFETLHLSFRFVSFAMPSLHIYSSVSFYLTSETRDWNLSLRCCITASRPVLLVAAAFFRLVYIFFLCLAIDCSIQFVVNQSIFRYGCAIRLVLGSTSKLMLPIWQVSRKMDIRSTMQCFSFFHQYFCVAPISLSSLSISLWLSILPRDQFDFSTTQMHDDICIEKRPRKTK